MTVQFPPSAARSTASTSYTAATATATQPAATTYDANQSTYATATASTSGGRPRVDLTSLHKALNDGKSDVVFKAGREAQAAGRDPEVVWLAAFALARDGHTAEATAMYESLSASKDPVWQAVGSSALAGLKGDFEGERQAASIGLLSDPNCPELKFQLGIAATRLGDPKAGMNALDEVCQAQPFFAFAHYNAGLAADRAGRTDLMANHFIRFLQLAPNVPEAGPVRSIVRTIY